MIIWVASYPKSGNTWVRSLISLLLFSKDGIMDNFELLDNAERLQMLDVPVLIGVSRKSMIYKTLNVPAAEALNGTTVLNTIALQKGASILRVHDVKPAVEAVRLVQALSQSEKGTAAI